MSGILHTASGFTFEYENLIGEGKVTAGEIEAIRGKIDQAHAAIEQMRATGEVQGHLSKDGAPEKVLFSQLPYIAPGHLNSPESIDRLKKFGASGSGGEVMTGGAAGRLVNGANPFSRLEVDRMA